jgi:hypothetical protein
VSPFTVLAQAALPRKSYPEAAPQRITGLVHQSKMMFAPREIPAYGSILPVNVHTIYGNCQKISQELKQVSASLESENPNFWFLRFALDARTTVIIK